MAAKLRFHGLDIAGTVYPVLRERLGDGSDFSMESISRISSILETARDLTLEAASSAGSAKGHHSAATKPIPFTQLKKLLDSRNDREILDGLRKVISMMHRSQPCLPYFSSVVKNVANPNIEVKKLVYIYLLHYAETEPDLALLSINAIQKSLTDQNPQVRVLALRTMSGIRVPVISQIVSLAIKRGCGDMSPHVRKAAALAIPKCYRLDPGTLPQLLEYLGILLGDKQYFVAGSAVATFLEICPERISMIHKHYRSLIKKLVDMDEWGQLATLRLMTVYARKCFPRRTKRLKTTGKRGFYEDEQDEEELGDEVAVLDPDLELLLKACRPLLQSRNSAVIIAVTRCYLHLGTEEYLNQAIGPLVALLRGPQDIQHIALYNVVSVLLINPKPFVRYTSHFLLHNSDPPHIWRLKLEVLTILFPHTGLHLKGVILSELEYFSKSSNLELVRESVQAIGRCAQGDIQTSARCLRLLLKQVSSPDENLVSESLTVIRHLIQQDPSSHQNTVIRLAKNLDSTTSSEARATIIWLVGEFAGVEPENNIAADVLRILSKGFADESEVAKQQIVLLAAKVYLHHLLACEALAKLAQEEQAPPDSTEESYQPVQEQKNDEDHPIAILWQYTLLLARYDTSYDLRDRARLFRSLLSTSLSTQLASLLLLAPKPVPHTPSPSESRKGLLIGSSSLVVGPESGVSRLKGYDDLPEWVEAGHEPDPKLRDEEGKAEYGDKKEITAGQMLDNALKQQQQKHGVSAKAAEPAGIGNAKEKTLDDWLAEDEGEDEEEESSEAESEEEGSTEEESSEEETDNDSKAASETQHLVK